MKDCKTLKETNNMNTPLVSIITVTYNRGKLLGRCIKSVLDQTYKNIEYIVIDGGSTDESDEVVNSFKEDKRLKYIKLNENRKVFLNYNYGASLAKGKYITYLDSDDEYLPYKIEKQVALIETLTEDYGMVYCWMTYFDSSKDNAFINVHKAELKGLVPIEASIKPCVSGTPTLLIRKDAFDAVGGFDEKADMTTDWEFCARFCHKWKVDYVPESLVNVYINHIYDRLSTQMRHNPAFRKNRIAMHEHYLDEFSDTFDKRMGARWYNYKSLAFFCMKDHDLWKTLKYTFLYVISAIENFVYEKFIKSKK